MPDHPTEQVDRVAATLRLHGDSCTRENADYLAEKVCAALDAATPARETIVAAVQDAVVAAMNTLGVTLVGSNFELVTSSPIPDDEVAEMVQTAVGSVGERDQ